MYSKPLVNRVLVADDDETGRVYIAGKPATLVYEIQEAVDSKSSLDCAVTFQAHVIISDIRMLRASGDETPVILLTEFGTIEDAVPAVHKTGAGQDCRAAEATCVRLDQGATAPDSGSSRAREYRSDQNEDVFDLAAPRTGSLLPQTEA